MWNRCNAQGNRLESLQRVTWTNAHPTNQITFSTSYESASTCHTMGLHMNRYMDNCVSTEGGRYHCFAMDTVGATMSFAKPRPQGAHSVGMRLQSDPALMQNKYIICGHVQLPKASIQSLPKHTRCALALSFLACNGLLFWSSQRVDCIVSAIFG